jgi:hypothetical protein
MQANITPGGKRPQVSPSCLFQCLINAQTGEVGFSTNMFGNPTGRAWEKRAPFVANLHILLLKVDAPRKTKRRRGYHYCDGGRGGSGAPMFLGGGGRDGKLALAGCGRGNWGVSLFSEMIVSGNPSIVSRRSTSFPYHVPLSSARVIEI